MNILMALLGYILFQSRGSAQSSIFDDLSSAFWQGNEILCGLFFCEDAVFYSRAAAARSHSHPLL